MPIRMSFDRVADIYDETRSLPPRMLSRVLAVLLEQLQGKRILEIGVGTGRFALPLQKSGLEVVGVDISRRMVELGLAKGLRNSIFADGARLPFAPRSFDVTTTNHVLHLVPDWRDMLLEIARVTRESYFSIVERGSKSPLQEAYHRHLELAGYTWQAPGLHERDLSKVLTPDLVMPVGPFRLSVPSGTILQELERRDYSSQWEVPEDLHRAAIAALRKTWEGKELEKEVTLEVTFWRADRLAELARRPL